MKKITVSLQRGNRRVAAWRHAWRPGFRLRAAHGRRGRHRYRHRSLDRRTSGTQVEDEAIEIKAANRIQENFGTRVRVSVTSCNRRSCLAAKCPSVASVPKVRLSLASTMCARSSTSWRCSTARR